MVWTESMGPTISGPTHSSPSTLILRKGSRVSDLVEAGLLHPLYCGRFPN